MKTWVFLSLVLYVASNDTEKCPGNFTTHKKHHGLCWYFTKTKHFNTDTAAEECKSVGGYLARFYTHNEFRKLAATMKDLYKWRKYREIVGLTVMMDQMDIDVDARWGEGDRKLANYQIRELRRLVKNFKMTPLEVLLTISKDGTLIGREKPGKTDSKYAFCLADKISN